MPSVLPLSATDLTPPLHPCQHRLQHPRNTPPSLHGRPLPASRMDARGVKTRDAGLQLRREPGSRKKTPHPSKDSEACCALRRCGDERLRPPGQSPDQHATRRDIMHLLIPLIWWVERTWPTARFPGNTAMTPRRGKRAMSRSSAAETREAGASSSCFIWCRTLFAACLASCDADHTVGKASF